MAQKFEYFEDYVPGTVHEFGGMEVSAEEIIEFARKYDPQEMHLDPEKAAQGRTGGLIASGWHTAAMAMRMMTDHYLSRVASLASPGVDELRWPNPVRPGDTLRIRATVIEARISRSKPDRGIVRSRVEMFNQRGQAVLSMLPVVMVGLRSRPNSDRY
ncbi:MAG: MaoC family dehydratase [Bryobacteraceae bacterium]